MTGSIGAMIPVLNAGRAIHAEEATNESNDEKHLVFIHCVHFENRNNECAGLPRNHSGYSYRPVWRSSAGSATIGDQH